jgi:benzoyl-CoA-dihydrodiol lyase
MAEIAAPIERASASDAPPLQTYDTHPDRYAHWKLSCDGTIATLALDVNEDRGLKPGYKLKLNSYDLGVDIELSDALQRIRFEHPEVRAVIVTSAKERIFCSGANIFMLGLSSHAWKVNFCKFTNETRNGIEDSSRYSGLKFIAACNACPRCRCSACCPGPAVSRALPTSGACGATTPTSSARSSKACAPNARRNGG